MHQSVKDAIFKRMEENDVGLVVITFQGGNDSGAVEDRSYFRILLTGKERVERHYGCEYDLDLEDATKDSSPIEDDAFTLFPNTVNFYSELFKAKIQDETFNRLREEITSIYYPGVEERPLEDLLVSFHAAADYIEEHLDAERYSNIVDILRKHALDCILATAFEEPIYKKYPGFAGSYNVEGFLVWDRGNRTVYLTADEEYAMSETTESFF